MHLYSHNPALFICALATTLGSAFIAEATRASNENSFRIKTGMAQSSVGLSFPIYVRGLGFKFVDFLCKISDICHTEIEMQLSENALFYISYKV